MIVATIALIIGVCLGRLWAVRALAWRFTRLHQQMARLHGDVRGLGRTRAMRRRIVNQRARLRQLQHESTMNLRIAENLARKLAKSERPDPAPQE